MSVGLIHTSTVSPLLVPTFSDADFATRAWVFTLSKANDWPTLPAAKVSPLTSVAGLPPAESFPLFSALHQLINPDGAGRQSAAHLIGTIVPMQITRSLRNRHLHRQGGMGLISSLSWQFR
jgi:hypothetical protein